MFRHWIILVCDYSLNPLNVTNSGTNRPTDNTRRYNFATGERERMFCILWFNNTPTINYCVFNSETCQVGLINSEILIDLFCIEAPKESHQITNFLSFAQKTGVLAFTRRLLLQTLHDSDFGHQNCDFLATFELLCDVLEVSGNT
jgi:hypothetical protein